MHISTTLQLENQAEIAEHIKKKLPELIKEELFSDESRLRYLIKQCVQGQIKSTITEILQGKGYKDFIRDKVMTEMGMKNNPLDDEYFTGLTHSQIAELAKKSIRLTDEHIKLNAVRAEVQNAHIQSEELGSSEFKQYFLNEFLENILNILAGEGNN
jgi:hypothetical protein|nr:MAG TPA: hypothetical protein [Caudoviricetes sp.]